MVKSIPKDSVGLVEAKRIHSDEPLALLCGRVLQQYDLVYETYGVLNSEASNAILVCHALSGDHHAAGYYGIKDKKPGWWETCIGPGKPIDTNHFFVVVVNNLGGCSGSTGPNTVNPKTGKLYGRDFPVITVKDWVVSQARLGDALGICKWIAVVGGSLGGMQALQWAIDFPDRLEHCVVIASAAKLSAQNIAFNEVARQAIMSDPNFCDGYYRESGLTPEKGLMLARMLGHITYQSDLMMGDKFGRELQAGKFSYDFDAQFQVESYLRYQAERFAGVFDANTYLLMTKVLDYFDPAAEFGGSLATAVQKAQCKFLVISFSSDWRFSPERSREIVAALLKVKKPVTYSEIESDKGHDAFLLPIPEYMDLFKAYMTRLE